MGEPKLAERHWTYDDYRKLDDDLRYEIIEGELLMSPAPNTSHQRLVRKIVVLLANFVSKENLGEIFLSPLDVILQNDTVVQPDIVFIAKENFSILQKHAIVGSPDLAVEVISPSSVYRDQQQKFFLYEKFGVREYWIVDPANQAINIFTLSEGKYEIFSSAAEKGKVSSKIFSLLEIDLSEIFSE